MSSLLRKRIIPGRPAPGRTWLGALAVVALLSTVLSLVAAAKTGPADTTALRATAAHAAAAQRSAATTAAQAPAKAPARKVSTTSTKTRSSSALAGAMTTGTTKTVAIMNYAFSPAELNVEVGDTVTWTNMDTAPHTVTVTSGPVKFASANLAKGQTFSYTFTTAGTYSYYCAVHPDMVAKVVVSGTSTTPTPTPTPTPTDPPMPMPSACGGLESAVDVFLQHFYAAHLQPSLLQQVTDALSIDQYAKTHTVLIENMLAPLVGGAQSAVDVFLQHVYAAHLETSPTEQVSQALALDQYVKTHTVMIENMVKPLVGGGVTSC
ncbi:cupredoxin domain-containing protein [Marmoricola sp. URHA0025 HA25]